MSPSQVEGRNRGGGNYRAAHPTLVGSLRQKVGWARLLLTVDPLLIVVPSGSRLTRRVERHGEVM